jgi:hypothetical protein
VYLPRVRGEAWFHLPLRYRRDAGRGESLGQHACTRSNEAFVVERNAALQPIRGWVGADKKKKMMDSPFGLTARWSVAPADTWRRWAKQRSASCSKLSPLSAPGPRPPGVAGTFRRRKRRPLFALLEERLECSGKSPSFSRIRVKFV